MVSKISKEHLPIIDWISENSKVLDLGCGNGSFLNYLTQHKGASGYGVELDDNKVLESIGSKINVIQLDLDKEDLTNYFAKNSMDYVVITQTLQVVKQPDQLLRQVVSIGKNVIVTFPNFAHWRLRLPFFLTGKTPESRSLPYHWYNTPNIRVVSFKDFENLCKQFDLTIKKKTVYDYSFHQKQLLRLFPNLLGAIGIFLITK